MAKKIAQLEAMLAELAEQNKALTAENKLLQQKVQHLVGRIFGRKTEQIDPAQLQLLMGIAEDLPTENIKIDPDEVKDSPNDYKRIGEEVTQELDVIPAQYIRRRFIRGKYVKNQDLEAAPIIAPLPERLIEGDYASAGII